MSDVGSPDNFIDTQGVVLENVTEGNIYDQVISIAPIEATHSMDFNQLTNDTVEKLFGLTNASFEVEMMATQPEILGLFNLTTPIGAQIPSNEWEIRLTDVSNNTTTVSGTAILNEFRIIDDGISFMTIRFKLEFVSSATVTTNGSSGVLNF
jgi:hypothetical protein